MRTNFESYDKENPQIWKEFERFTLQTISRGFRHYSAKGIFEIIRWHTGIFANKGFKVNNNFTPDYSRKFESVYPQHKGFFEQRVLKSKS